MLAAFGFLKSLTGIVMALGILGTVLGGYGTYRWIALSFKYDEQAKQLERAELVRADLAVCRLNAGELSQALDEQNRAVVSLTEAGEKAMQRAREAVQGASQAKRKSEALAARIAALEPLSGNACQRADDYLRAYFGAGR